MIICDGTLIQPHLGRYMGDGRAVAGRKASPTVCLTPAVPEPPVIPRSRALSWISTRAVNPKGIHPETRCRRAISNRNWPKNRKYRKQATKPCLTGTRIAIRALAICRPAQAYLALFASLVKPQIHGDKTPQIRRAVPVTDRGKISPLPRATAKNLCGTLEVWGNSEVA